MVHKNLPMGDSMEKRTALYIFGICGLVGILVDLDHFIALLSWWYINPKVAEGRIWHTPLFILSCLGICYLVSHIPRLHGRLVLIGIILATVLTLVFSSVVIWRI